LTTHCWSSETTKTGIPGAIASPGSANRCTIVPATGERRFFCATSSAAKLRLACATSSAEAASSRCSDGSEPESASFRVVP
jgi:hypothetical protein